VRTDGNGSSREISFSFLLRVFRAAISNPEKESNLSDQSFAALGVSAQTAEALSADGIHNPFPIQALVVPSALSGSDILAKSPTGSGKTLAFGLPIVERISTDDGAPSVLILVPTRELASQVAEAIGSIARRKGLRVAAAYGGAPIASQAKRISGAHILVATPGRLQDLIERRRVTLSGVRILILDEADRMLDMGFKPQVDKIVRSVPRERQTMLFSATLDGEVGELARAYTNNPARFEADHANGHENGEIAHRFVSVPHEGKVDALISELEKDRGLALVFVRTKRGADRLVAKLSRRDVKAAALHGDMAQGARERALARFHSGQVTTLVATDVAARGLDLADITHVINFDPPEDGKGYVHRVGRTGRAGRSGSGVTFVTPEQQADVSRVAVGLGHREEFESQGMTVARPRLLYTSRRGRRSRW
jgi:superfamily II DNA/RNA helicase